MWEPCTPERLTVTHHFTDSDFFFRQRQKFLSSCLSQSVQSHKLIFTQKFGSCVIIYVYFFFPSPLKFIFCLRESLTWSWSLFICHCYCVSRFSFFNKDSFLFHSNYILRPWYISPLHKNKLFLKLLGHFSVSQL